MRIKLENICKKFDNVTAVNDLNLEVYDGAFVTLLGPSGCGKSTTLLCVAGLEEPTSGSILFGDDIVNDWSPADRNIAMVFQDYALYPHMSVEENLLFPLKMRKEPQSSSKERVLTVSRTLGLHEFLSRKPAELSGGQRQRVALGRAIVRNPSIFLMDEPLSNLDAALRISTRTEIKALQRNLGITTLYVTHDQEEAMVLADYIAIMWNGTLQQYDTPSNIYDKPANLFVAGFVGSPKMNFIEGNLEVNEGSLVFSCQQFTSRFALDCVNSETLKTKLNSKISAILGIRHEDILIFPEREDDRIAGEVRLNEPTGPVTYIDLLCKGQELKASVKPSEAQTPGSSIWFSFIPGRGHFFDVDSGSRV